MFSASTTGTSKYVYTAMAGVVHSNTDDYLGWVLAVFSASTGYVYTARLGTGAVYPDTKCILPVYLY